VLLDAPCSATGTIRRNPDIPYLKAETDIAALSAVQAKLLEHAISLLKPGGRLIYCTCSLEAEEGEAQVARIMERRASIAIDPIKASDANLAPEMIAPGGVLRTLPFHMQLGQGLNGIDGFFAARFVRTS
jgi:16S rRNA (cytosine967-C5)-methyltransferase